MEVEFGCGPKLFSWAFVRGARISEFVYPVFVKKFQARRGILTECFEWSGSYTD